jgi:hypothetical protein
MQEPEDMSKFNEETTPTLTPEEQQDLNDTLLLLIKSKASKEAIDIIIEQGATVDAADQNGTTALMWAANKGHTESINALIAAGADLNVTNREGHTALMEAILYESTAIAIALINAGANVNADDNTALMYAAQGGNTEVINALINAGADVKVGWGSDTPLVFATQNGYTEAIDALNSHNQRLNQVANFLIDRADIDGQGRIRVNVNNLNDNEKALLEDAKRFNTNNIQEALQATGREKGIDEEIARLMMEDVKTHDPLNYKTYLSIPKIKGKHLNEGVMTEIFSFLPKEDQSNLRFAGILRKDAATRENATRAPAAVAVAGGGKDPNSYHTEVRKKAQEIGKELSDAQPDYNQQNTSGKRKREPTEVTTGDEKRIRLDAQQARVDPNDPRKPSSNTPPPPPSSPKGGHGI